MSLTVKLVRPPEEEYDDSVLYGPRIQAAKAETDQNSDCVLFTVGTAYADERLQWQSKELYTNDGRLRKMMEELDFMRTMPLQRYAWPQMKDAKFPLLVISPEGTGKTIAHILYSVTRCITAIPISKTNALLMDRGPSKNSFKPSDHIAPDKKNKFPCGRELYDSDSMGHIAEKLQPNGTRASTNETTDEEKTKTNGTREEVKNGWGDYEFNAEDFIFHPKYIIVSSSPQQVENMEREIQRMKLHAYIGKDKNTNIRIKDFPPVVKTINVHHDEAKLALKCNEAEILISTPGPLIKCFGEDYLNFFKCEKIFFDDLDLTLQLHNFKIRELVKMYLSLNEDQNNCQSDGSSKDKLCQLYFFSRKWTDLVKNFKLLFPQLIIMFSSLAEAALYSNMRYEIELCSSPEARRTKLLNLINILLNNNLHGENNNEKVAILCRNDEDAEKVSEAIANAGYHVKFLPKDTPLIALRERSKYLTNGMRIHNLTPVCVMSDAAVDLVAEDLSDVTSLIHFSLPQTMFEFDQRFRLAHSIIKNGGNEQTVCSTLFFNNKLNAKHAKEIYDMMTRSNTTLQCTKLALRDLISHNPNTICWRWASSGVCRLEKLSRADRFGSYCPDRHSISTISKKTSQVSRLPTGGQVKITITNLVSPNELYFWFESHRDMNSSKWSNLDFTGSVFMKNLQNELDKYKNTREYSVERKKLIKGKIFGIYFQQTCRVDRVKLIEEPATDATLEQLTRDRIGYTSSAQCEVLRLDYGERLHVYAKNLFELPESIADIEPQCHRAFLLGVKPTENEPDWLHKVKQRFYRLVCVNNLQRITVWLRLSSNGCFWFEKMIIARKLGNVDDNRLYTTDPHLELLNEKLAEESKREPTCLNPSERLLTESKWHVEESKKYVQYAFLRRDKSILDIFVMHILGNLDLTVRNYHYNKLLINLENRMCDDFNNGKLDQLNYFEPEVYCLAKIQEGVNPTTNEPVYTINRAKILSILGNQDEPADVKESRYLVECLDHGDEFVVEKSQLYHAAPEYIKQLPFQAIKGVKLANLKPEILANKQLTHKIAESMYGFTRSDSNELIKVSCCLTTNATVRQQETSTRSGVEVQLFIPRSATVAEPVESLFKRLYDIDLLDK